MVVAQPAEVQSRNMADSTLNDGQSALTSRAAFAQTTGARLRNVRRQRGMSLAQLAAVTGLSRSFSQPRGARHHNGLRRIIARMDKSARPHCVHALRA